MDDARAAVQSVRRTARRLYSARDVARALDRMAAGADAAPRRMQIPSCSP